MVNTGNDVLPVGVGGSIVVLVGYAVVTGEMSVRLPVESGTLRVELIMGEKPCAEKPVPVGSVAVELADVGGKAVDAVIGAVVLTNGVSSDRVEETVTTTVVSGGT